MEVPFVFISLLQVASALAHEKNVVGFDTLNEPNAGWIGRTDLGSRTDGLAFRWGLNLSPFELMALGAGFGNVEGDLYSPPFVFHGTQVLNPNNLSAWHFEEVDDNNNIKGAGAASSGGGAGAAAGGADGAGGEQRKEGPGWGGCVWRANGVWDIDRESGEPVLLRPDHFQMEPVRKRRRTRRGQT